MYQLLSIVLYLVGGFYFLIFGAYVIILSFIFSHKYLYPTLPFLTRVQLFLLGAWIRIKNKIPNDQITYIFDNEPRNKEIVKRMYKVIEQDFNVVIWPEELQLKDVNDMILSGLTKIELQDIISNNTYSKLSALTKLNYWKKTKEV